MPHNSMDAVVTVYHARAGIYLHKKRLGAEFEGLPRMRGDPPKMVANVSQWDGSTPHARGSTAVAEAIKAVEDVYPACAGIHPSMIQPPM